MHDIEPYYHWRDRYIAEEDRESPMYGRTYDEFYYTNRIYNYYIHPQWDDFGSPTLYMKIIFVDYEEGFAMIELIGEWNDCVTNDIMSMKREVIDKMLDKGIHRYLLLCGNVLNFHGDEEDYYEEWHEDVSEEGGWICMINLLDHVEREMLTSRLQHYVYFGDPFNEIAWRRHEPEAIFSLIESLINRQAARLHG